MNGEQLSYVRSIKVECSIDSLVPTIFIEMYGTINISGSAKPTIALLEEVK